MPEESKNQPARPTTERRWRIAQEVEQRQQVSVAELSRRFDVSKVAIRRDLEYLEQAGLLRRVHGGAQASAASGQLSIFEARLLQNTGLKQALGRAALDLIRPGQVIFLDSGTTVLEIARQLPRILEAGGSLTVLTRSLMIASELRTQRRIRLIVIGGVYLPDFDDFVGSQVEQALPDIHADTLFLGTDGVSLDYGLTTDNVLEAGLYRSLAGCAQRVVVVSDSSKIGVAKVQATLTFDEVHTFVTDDGAPPDFVSSLRERGCEVIVVPSSKQERK